MTCTGDIPVAADTVLVDLVPTVVQGDTSSLGACSATNAIAQFPDEHLADSQGICAERRVGRSMNRRTGPQVSSKHKTALRIFSVLLWKMSADAIWSGKMHHRIGTGHECR